MRRRTAADEIPHIVEEYKIGNTIAKIADNYCRNTTAEEVKARLRNIAEIALRSAYARTSAEENEKQKELQTDTTDLDSNTCTCDNGSIVDRNDNTDNN